MRLPRLASALLTVIAGPAAVTALPVLTPHAVARPHPVTPSVQRIAVPDAGAPSLRARARTAGPVVQTPPDSTAPFQLVGATWDRGTLGADTHVQIRVRDAGRWSAWTDLEPGDAAPDDGSRDARAAKRANVVSAEPVWIGHGDGVQTRVVGTSRAPRHLQVVLVNGGHSAADAAPGAPQPLASAAASIDQPTIYSRAQWGADESLRLSQCPGGPDYGSTIKVGFLHHTDTSNDYSSGDVPAIIRSIYAYHVQTNGWCDIGYNFLIDKFGRIWEGRYGGVAKPVIGAHTGGFNTDTFGASMIGTYTSTAPPAAMQSAVARLWAWKLGLYYRDPTGYQYVTAAPFSGSRYPAGTNVKFATLSGHRDADTTTCPGDAAYSLLPNMRNGVKAAMGAALIEPTVTSGSLHYGDANGSITIQSRVTTSQTWTLTVTDSSGSVVTTVTGSASPSSPIVASWNGLTSAGARAIPGVYNLRLDSTNGSSTARAFVTTGTVISPVQLTAPATTVLGSTVTITGTAPAGSTLTLFLHKRNTTGYVESGTTTADFAGNVSFRYVADDDYRWYAQTSDGIPSNYGLTQIAPTVSGPPQANAGTQVTVSGTTLPLTGVQLYLERQGASSYAAGPSATSDGSGRWTASYSADATYSYYAWSRGLRSSPSTTEVLAPPALNGPTQAGYRTSVRLTGVGNPGESVAIWTRPAGAADFTQVASVPAAADGSFAWSFTADTDYDWYATNAVGRSGTGRTVVAPTLTGPRYADRGSTVTLTGTALPGTSVQLYLHRRYTTGYAPGPTVTAASDGGITFTYTEDEDYRWYAVSRAVRSDPPGLTQVTPVPTVTGPGRVAWRQTVPLTGTALPGQWVELWLHKRYTVGYTHVSNVLAGSDGRFATSFPAIDDYRWYVKTTAGPSAPGLTQVFPTLTGPAHAGIWTIVTLQGSAFPGAPVTVYFHRRNTIGYVARRWLTADSNGRFTVVFRINDDYRYYAASNGRTSTPGLIQVH